MMISFQCRRRSCMQHSLLSSEKWVSLTMRRTSKHWLLLLGMYMPRWSASLGILASSQSESDASQNSAHLQECPRLAVFWAQNLKAMPIVRKTKEKEVSQPLTLPYMVVVVSLHCCICNLDWCTYISVGCCPIEYACSLSNCWFLVYPSIWFNLWFSMENEVMHCRVDHCGIRISGMLYTCRCWHVSYGFCDGCRVIHEQLAVFGVLG